MKVFCFDNDGFVKQKRKYYPIKVSNPHIEFINQSMRLQYENKNGKVCCPYCKKVAELVPCGVVYGYTKSYALNLIYLCRDCEAWVGTHTGTIIPLGTLANERLRLIRQKAHKHFDPIWKNRTTRERGYRWLSQQMGLPFDKTHIGMFNEEQCKKVIEVSKAYFERNAHKRKRSNSVSF